MNQPSHADLRDDMRHIRDLIGEVKVDVEASSRQISLVGERLKAIEAKVLAYDLLKARLIGMATVSAGAIVAAWYWLHDKIEAALGK